MRPFLFAPKVPSSAPESVLRTRSWLIFWLARGNVRALPSQFPSDRIAPKGHRLRAYSIGDMLRNLTGFPDHRTCRENAAAWVTPCSVFDLREYL